MDSSVFTDWARNDFRQPSPQHVKWSVIKRHCSSGSLFIETGTYFGATALYMAKSGFPVVSIELSEELFRKAQITCAVLPNIKLFNGDSGKLLCHVLESETSSFEKITIFFGWTLERWHNCKGQSRYTCD